jgi:RNA polymerase-binding transcription factor DksA
MTQSAVPAARGAPFPDSQLAVLRGMLEQQRRFRLDQLEQLQRSDQLGMLSGSDREISDSLIRGARAALRDVVDALQRMDDGRYGSCRRCGTTLEPARLEVLPQVSLCVTCQRAAEDD